jgi:hypothetical protein
MDRNSEQVELLPSSTDIEVSGLVLTENSVIPVENVMLDFGNNWSTTSRVDGTYGPISIPVGVYAVKLSKQGFNDTFHYTPELTNSTSILDFTINGGEVSVYGEIYDGNGNIITNAEITSGGEMLTANGISRQLVSHTQKGTLAGYYDITMAKGSDRIYTVSAPGYETVELTVDINGHTKQNIILIPEPSVMLVVFTVILMLKRKG